MNYYLFHLHIIQKKVTDKSERFFVEEIIREKILKHYKKEVPYSVEISVEEFIEEDEIVKLEQLFMFQKKSKSNFNRSQGFRFKKNWE